MKKSHVVILVCAFVLIGSGTALALSISNKQPEPEIGNYNDEFVAQYISENKAEINGENGKESVPCFNEDALIFENDGCFQLGTDPGNVSTSFRTDFLERMVKIYPDPLVREYGDFLYLVYDSDKHTRLFLFYSKERTNGMILSGYPIIMKQKLSYNDFSEIHIGNSIEEVEIVDSIIALYLTKFIKLPDDYYKRNLENGIYFSSLHLLTDGILKIEYDRNGEDYIIINITYRKDFILEGGFGKINYEIYETDYVE